MSDQEQGNDEGSAPECTASKRKSPPVVTNDGSVRDELSAPEKLRIGGFAAPILRAAAKDGRNRRKVNVVGKDGTVRESTLGEVQQGLIVAHGLEFEVAEKTPDTTYACRVCAREFVWDRRGAVPKSCDGCRKCACGAVLKNKWVGTGVCKACKSKHRAAAQKRSATMRKTIPPCACGAVMYRRDLYPSSAAGRAAGESAKPQCKQCRHLDRHRKGAAQ